MVWLVDSYAVAFLVAKKEILRETQKFDLVQTNVSFLEFQAECKATNR